MVGWLWEWYRECRRHFRDTYPESHITKCTIIRRESDLCVGRPSSTLAAATAIFWASCHNSEFAQMTKSSFSTALICTTRRRIAVSTGANEGSEQGDLINISLNSDLCVDRPSSTCAAATAISRTSCRNRKFAKMTKSPFSDPSFAPAPTGNRRRAVQIKATEEDDLPTAGHYPRVLPRPQPPGADVGPPRKLHPPAPQLGVPIFLTRSPTFITRRPIFFTRSPIFLSRSPIFS